MRSTHSSRIRLIVPFLVPAVCAVLSLSSCDILRSLLGLDISVAGRVTIPLAVNVSQPTNVRLQFMTSSSQPASFAGSDIAASFDGTNREVQFSFPRVPVGSYLLRAFLDLNGDGILQQDEPSGTYPSSGQLADFSGTLEAVAIALAVPGPGSWVPAAPFGLLASSATATSLAVSWSQVPGADSYTLYWAQGAAVTPATGTAIPNAVSPQLVTGLVTGAPYAFLVTALNSHGESAASAVVSAMPGTPPTAPVGTGADAGNGMVSVSWVQVSGASSYNLYWAQGPAVTTATGTKVSNVASPQDILGLENGTRYAFLVTAQNAYGESAASQVATAIPGTPHAPKGFLVTVGDGQLVLSWDPVADAASFNLYWAQGSGVTTETGGKVEGVTSPYTLGGLSNGQPHALIVAARNVFGEGPATPVMVVSPGAPPSAVTPFAAAGDSHVSVRWGAVPGAVSYNLYWAQGSSVTTGTGAKVGGVKSPAVISALTNDLQHAFIVTAENAFGESAAGAVVTATPAAGAPTGNLGSWKTASNAFSTPRSFHASVVNNKYLYVLGGDNNGTSALDDIQYAPLLQNGDVGSWHTASLPFPRASFGAAASNGYLYVVGGWSQPAAVPTSTVFFAPFNPDGSVGLWQATASLPVPRSGHACVAFNGYIYVTGGYDGSARANDVLYAQINSDGTLGSWKSAAPFSDARGDHCSAAYGGYLYVLGGDAPNTVFDDIQFAAVLSDGSLGGWQTAQKSMPRALMDFSTIALEGILYVLGGTDTQAGHALSSVIHTPLAADGSPGPWFSDTSLPSARYALACVGDASTFYALGGTDGSSFPGDLLYSPYTKH